MIPSPPCTFCNFREYKKTLERKQESQPPINLLPSLWIQPQSSWCNPRLLLCHLSPVSTHVMSIPGPSLIEVIQPSRCQTRGVLSLSLSSGCDSGSTLIPLPSIPSSARQRFYGNTAAESSPDPPLYESMEHAANITPCTPFPGSTLAFAHNSLLSSCTTQKEWAEALMGMYWLVRKLVRGMLLSLRYEIHKQARMYSSTWFTGTNAGRKEDVWVFVSQFLLTNPLWNITVCSLTSKNVLYNLFTNW